MHQKFVKPIFCSDLDKIRSGYKLKYTCSRMLLGTRDVSILLNVPTHSGQRTQSRTPAMAAGLTHRRWTVQDLLGRPVPLLVQ